MKTKLLSLIGYLLLVGCGYDTFGEYQIPGQTLPTPTITIKELCALYSDKTVIVNRDYIVQGYVTSSDREGNFYRSFFIQDQSGAIEIMAGLSNLSNIYPVGQRVILKALGLALTSKNSIMQLGLVSQSGNPNGVDYLDHRALLDRYVLRADNNSLVSAAVSELSTLKKEDCGTLIRVNGVSYADGFPSTWGSTDGASGGPTMAFRRFEDQYGNSIYVATSMYAKFARAQIPQAEVSLIGILEYGKAVGSNQVFILKIKDLGDVVSL